MTSSTLRPITSLNLHMPFGLRISPHNEPAWQHTVNWVKDFGLVPEKMLGYFRALDYHWLSAWAFPDADLAKLELVNDWMTLFYFFDKEWDDAPPEVLKAAQGMLLSILRGNAALPAEAGPKEKALHNVRDRMLNYSPKGWMEHFSGSIEAYFNACIWEAQNKSAQKIPDVDSYVEMRRNTGAVQPSFELAGVLHLVELPPDRMEHPSIHRLNELANDEITLFNDLISLEKEMRVGDVHNMVFILKHVHGCSLEEARDRTVELHNDKVREFEKVARDFEKQVIVPSGLGTQVPGWDKADNAGALNYIEVLRCWMRSNMEWSLMSERYRSA